MSGKRTFIRSKAYWRYQQKWSHLFQHEWNPAFLKIHRFFLFLVLRGNNYQIKPEGLIHYLPVMKEVYNQQLLHCSSLATRESQRACSNTQKITFLLLLHYLHECETDLWLLWKIPGQLKTCVCQCLPVIIFSTIQISPL